MGNNNVTLRGRIIRPFSLAHACCYARHPLCHVPSMHCRPVSLTSWVCAHERFANVRIQLGQPLFRCAPRYARDMSNLHANQSKEILLF
jgi:hypothetical protein